MSFLRYAGRQYMNQSREEQFIRYFRDTGASSALQKGMILLFKMPTKPSNLAQFFAEYLDNGAKDLADLALLKAELCYKHSETQNLHRKIKNLENQIATYESQGYGKNRASRGGGDADVDEGDEHLVLDADKENPIRYSMLDRFLVDLDERPQSESTVPSSTELGGDGDDQKDEDDENEDDFKEEVQPIGSEEALRLKEQASLTNWNNDIKKIDPWGIVCTTKTFNGRISTELEEGAGDAQPENVKKDVDVTLTPQQQIAASDLEEKQMMMSEVQSIGKSSGSDYQKDEESEDAETLVEVYHAYASAFDKLPSENNGPKDPTPIPIHHLYRLNHHLKNDVIPPDTDKDTKLLSVALPAKSDPDQRRGSGGKGAGDSGDKRPRGDKRLGDMMGWSKEFCHEVNKERWAAAESAKGQGQGKAVPISDKPSEFPRPNWSQFTEMYGNEVEDKEEEEDVDEGPNDPCLENVDFYRDIKWQDDAPKPFPISAKDESFLLDYDMARIARKLDSPDDPGFMFEFYQNFDPSTAPVQEEPHFCENCQRWKVNQMRRATGRVTDVTVATSTTGLNKDYDPLGDDDDICRCGEDCGCICEDGKGGLSWKLRSGKKLSNTPGKMMNWTKEEEEEEDEEEELEETDILALSTS